MKAIAKIFIVAGESSGDILGAGLIRELKRQYPECQFEGIGGERMLAEGFRSLVPMEKLSVMGLLEPLFHLRELLGILAQVKARCLEWQPDIFVGVDSPDFNLRVEEPLRRAGIFCVHYVSPSVWAWRQGRIKKIKRSVDLMLTLFPFEAEFYRRHDVDVEFVGHPLADQLPIAPDRDGALRRLGLGLSRRYIALLPGSRKFEVANMLPVFLDAVQLLKDKYDFQYLIPAASRDRLLQIQTLVDNRDVSSVTVVEGRSHDVMEAADVVVMASGTTTLEAMLLKKPMVICYKLATLSYWIFRCLVKVPFIGLPNLLAGKSLVPELIQQNMSADAIAAKVSNFIDHPEAVQALDADFQSLHSALKKDADVAAARAVIDRWQTARTAQ